jgi:hypothetical protein
MRAYVDSLAQCGTAHITLCDCNPDGCESNGVQWYRVTAMVPCVPNAGPVDYSDYRLIEITVGHIAKDRRRCLYIHGGDAS